MTTMHRELLCNECCYPVSPTDIKCHICLQWFHKNGANLYQHSCNNATENTCYLCCMNCVQLFPFHAISLMKNFLNSFMCRCK